MRSIEALSSFSRETLYVLMHDHGVASIAQPCLFPALNGLRSGPPGEQFRIQNTTVEVDASARRVLTTARSLGKERSVPEVEIHVIGADTVFGDPQLAHASAGVEFEPVIPVQGE